MPLEGVFRVQDRQVTHLEGFVQSLLRPLGCHMVQQVIDVDRWASWRPRAATCGSACRSTISCCVNWIIINP